MKTREEIRGWLLENAVDEDGDLMLDDLDFSDFAGDVYINGLKVQGDLIQSRQEVQGNLYQSYHEVQGNLRQDNQKVQGILTQSNQKVQGYLTQSYQEVQGNLYHGGSRYGGELIEYPYSKLFKEITSKELAELDYKLKENEND